MEIRPIRTEADHRNAVAAIEALWNAEPGTPEADTLDVLATLVDAYETEQFPIEALDPVEAIKAHMDIGGYDQSDLAELLGSKSRASEILNRRRALTVEQIHRISDAWKIPAGLLVQPYVVLSVTRRPEIRKRVSIRRPLPKKRAAG